MKKIISTLLCLCFSLTFPSAVIAEEIQVKSGLNVPIVIIDNKTSNDLIGGSQLRAVIEDNIKIKNTVVFKKGDPAFLYISEVKKAGFLGVPGYVVLSNGKVFDVNKNAHNIQYINKVEGKEKTYPKVLLGISIFMLFPLALFSFIKGGEAKITGNIPLYVILNDDFGFSTSL